MTIKKALLDHFTTAHDAHAQAMDGEPEGTRSHAFHKSMKESCGNDLAACSKSDESELEKALRPLPEGLSVLTPNHPHLRAVPRAGQQPIPERPNVPQEFEKLVIVDEDEERVGA